MQTAFKQERKFSLAKFVMVLLAIAILLAGVLRYAKAGWFSLGQAGLCLLAIPLALVILMVLDYVLHHARLVAIMVLLAIVLLAVQTPAFCVGLGLALAGMVLAQR